MGDHKDLPDFQAAIIRLGLKEMIKYGDTFYPGGDHATYFESCGVADLITTCYGGRNRKVSEAFVARKKSIVELETEMLNGQKLQGPETAAEVRTYSGFNKDHVNCQFIAWQASCGSSGKWVV